jgi:hypothetical protein
VNRVFPFDNKVKGVDENGFSQPTGLSRGKILPVGDAASILWPWAFNKPGMAIYYRREFEKIHSCRANFE